MAPLLRNDEDMTLFSISGGIRIKRTLLILTREYYLKLLGFFYSPSDYRHIFLHVSDL